MSLSVKQFKDEVDRLNKEAKERYNAMSDSEKLKLVRTRKSFSEKMKFPQPSDQKIEL